MEKKIISVANIPWDILWDIHRFKLCTGDGDKHDMVLDLLKLSFCGMKQIHAWQIIIQSEMCFGALIVINTIH